MGPKVVAAGHICIDITPVFPGGNPLAYRELLTPGKLIHVDAADIHTGGSVANAGLAMGLFGVQVQLAGKIGQDAFGDMVLERLRQRGCAQGLIRDPQGSTSYSVVLAPPGVDRIFLHHPGANDTFLSGDIPQRMLEEAALLHFGYPPLMKGMYENDGEETFRLMRRARELGAATSLDMAAVDPASPAGQVNWRRALEKTLPYVDFFVPSVEELGFMLDRHLYESWQKKATGQEITGILSVEADIRPLAQECLALGARVVLVKCGARGMYWCAGQDVEHISPRVALPWKLWAGKEGFERSFVPARVLSATGAGDTSIAAFLAAMLEGCPPEACVELATAAGACCVESYGALDGLLPLPQIRERIRAGWEKQ